MFTQLVRISYCINPHLEDIDQIIAAYNIHWVTTKKRKRNGEMDWYALLNITNAASADTEAIQEVVSHRSPRQKTTLLLLKAPSSLSPKRGASYPNPPRGAIMIFDRVPMPMHVQLYLPLVDL
uniref:Uncharacterized protein n=1 Tax=Nelumbo nucifera TaxID=4432 RepID=A0A822YYH9_NELNU|nr:TPA_asm: hypothetical protein HUJ06_008238 [Nelumbo nucifera]